MRVDLYPVPDSSAWRGHVSDRIAGGVELGLLPGSDCVDFREAEIFAPTGISIGTLSGLGPDCSLRDLFGERIESGWQIRNDLFLEAAEWLVAYFKRSQGCSLFLEAGYSSAGDPVLQGRDHIVVGGNPLLKISLRNAESTAKVLRYSRSSRVLGVVLEGSADSAGFSKGNLKMFLCDALAQDSLLVAPVKLRKSGSDSDSLK